MKTLESTKYITRDPEILGGAPVIAGTRVPVERLKFLIEQGYTERELKKNFPAVSPKKIRYAISELLDRGLRTFEHNEAI